MIDRLRHDRLVWLPELGVGHFPVRKEAEPYDAGYFAKYAGYADTPLGQAITALRVELVEKHHAGTALDIGIGCGAFIEKRGESRTLGYDINPAAVDWLTRRNRMFDPYAGVPVPALTCWDSLEHVEDPAALVACASKYVFCSLPIFRDADHVLRSKHYRKDEHRWYWTDAGLIGWMEGLGFRCVERSDAETEMGREDIGTYVFRRGER